MKIWQTFRNDYQTAAATLRTYRGGLRGCRPHVLDRDSAAMYAEADAANPLMRRFPRNERNRIAGEMRAELENNRRAAGAVARFHAHGVRAIITRARDVIARARRDVLLSMPDALQGVSADGSIMLSVLETMLAPSLEAATPTAKLGILQEAYRRKDPRAYVETTIIERQIASGVPLAGEDVERAASRRLREYVAGVQDLRVPTDLPDIDELEAEANRLDARAEALQLQPLNPEQHPAARQAFDELRDGMTAAGEASDADDQAALRSELAS